MSPPSKVVVPGRGVTMKALKYRGFSWCAAVTVAVFLLLASPAAASPGRGVAVRPDDGEVVAQQAPVIENIFPSAAWPGTPVTIQGKDFGLVQLPAVCTVTFNGVDAGTAVLWTDTYIVVMVPEGATSGPVVVTTLAGSSNPYPFTVYEQPQAVSAYFAEGCTRAGFEEWLTLFNPYDAQYTVTVTYMVSEGANRIRYYNLPAHSRTNVYVNSEIGSDRDVALQVTATDRIYAERSLYFRYGTDWLGGHCSIPAVEAAPDWYFAEGCTHAGFEEWLCLANPGSQDASVEVRYLFPDGDSETRTYSLPAWKRYTVNVNREVGPGRDVALAVHSDLPIVAERPMYFDYGGMWDGGHITLGASSLSPNWYFAEGCTHAGFHEWLLLFNPGEEAAQVHVTFAFSGGEAREEELEVAPRRRLTLFVNREAGEGRDVSLRVHSDRDLVAERSMYFLYHQAWEGGHNSMGAVP
ncbi:MAG: IPT/TIG domain-containing protein [Actinobacteria bacterium]|nr:IPT/TIG domain-containing protein [Actinomycetota bacterium]